MCVYSLAAGIGKASREVRVLQRRENIKKVSSYGAVGGSQGSQVKEKVSD